jgi:uncharacterized protein YbjT (DUF2867 family)
MKILVTGASGYIGKQLIYSLIETDHEIVALVRRPVYFDLPKSSARKLSFIQGDLLDPNLSIPPDIDAAYYLVHSMGAASNQFDEIELRCAKNFVSLMQKINLKQVIYLSGISHDETLSKHLASRKAVENILITSGLPYTILHSGMIIGAGSASFEIIRDLTEVLPIMIAPKWVEHKTQPIAIDDVLFYLKAVLGSPLALNQTFEIGGPDQPTYKEMLLGYAKIRGLKRFIINVPFFTPRLSSYWLYFISSVNFSLASALVDSLRNKTTCQDNRIQALFPHTCINYEEAIQRALNKIEQNPIIGSWRDALVLSRLGSNLKEYIQVPTHGCLTDKQKVFTDKSRQDVINKIWSIGGRNGWYYANWTWQLRGLADKIFGGVGLNRGRTNLSRIEMGDVIDFWRVLVADKEQGRLLLYAEMKLPGEAWLEFKVISGKRIMLEQTATFRPKGVLGRLYWYTLFPIHTLIFRGMANAIAIAK